MLNDASLFMYYSEFRVQTSFCNKCLFDVYLNDVADVFYITSLVRCSNISGVTNVVVRLMRSSHEL